MTKTFSAFDAYEQRCQEEEIGQAWEDRWGISDIKEGRCMPYQLGKPKQPGDQQQLPGENCSPDNLNDDERVKAACIEHGVDIMDIPAVTRLMFRLWPYSFSKTHGPLVRAEADRVEAEKALRQSRDASLADMTANRLKGMSTQDIWLKVILAVKRHTDEKQFVAILEEWGISPAELAEMIEAGELA